MDGGSLSEGKASARIKIYLVVGLGLVLAALVYRHLKANPSRNGKISPATAPALVAEAPEMPDLIPGSVAAIQPAQAKVKELRRTSIRDIFAPMRPLKKGEQRITPVGQPRVQRAPTLKLKGVIVSGSNPVAIINGKFLRLGQRIDGYQVVRIEENKVFLRSGNTTLKLELAKND